MQDPRNFNLNSDYPIDKMVQFSVGNFTLPAFNNTSSSFIHGLPYAPLYLITWSTTPTFDISYNESGVTINDIQLSAQVDASNMYIIANNNTSTSVTFYYRAMFMPRPDLDPDALATIANDSYVFNSDNNYTKIFMEGVTTSGTATIDHNLGFRPQVEAWYIRQSDNRLIHLVQNDVTSTGSPRVTHSTTQVTFSPGTFPVAARWYYKIYGDEL